MVLQIHRHPVDKTSAALHQIQGAIQLRRPVCDDVLNPRPLLGKVGVVKPQSGLISFKRVEVSNPVIRRQSNIADIASLGEQSTQPGLQLGCIQAALLGRYITGQAAGEVQRGIEFGQQNRPHFVALGTQKTLLFLIPVLVVAPESKLHQATH